jgi:hypothetical protein
MAPLLAAVPGLRKFGMSLPNSTSAFDKLGFQSCAEEFGLPREFFVAAQGAEGLAVDLGFRALYAGRSVRRYRAGSDLAEADRAHQETILLHHPISHEDADVMQTIATAVRRIHEHAKAFAVTGAV